MAKLSRSAPEPDISPTTGESTASSAPIQQVGSYKATYHASGITSTVYRSVSSVDQSTIAIKLTTPSRMEQPHNAYREARLLRKAAHPSVIELLSTESAPGGHFLLGFPFMPYDLATLIQQRSLTVTQTKSHLYSLFNALQHIHSLDILHRDIKPSNVLLASLTGPAFLADFGIAWHNDDPESEPENEKITDVGTTCYRAPELLFGNRAYGKGLDMWAAGCVVAEALKGQSLFDAGDLGSELALLRSIFQTLGTPSDDIWPEAKTFPDWGKMQFTVYPPKEWKNTIPVATHGGRELVAELVQYQSTERMSATEAIKHPFFEGIGEVS